MNNYIHRRRGKIKHHKKKQKKTSEEGSVTIGVFIEALRYKMPVNNPHT